MSPAQRWRRASRLLRSLAALLLGGLLALAATGASSADQAARFRDVAARVGLDFTHFNGHTGRYTIVEVMGSGGGFLDYDSDGDLDVYLLDGAALPGTPPASRTPRNRLFRNDAGRYTDVTAAARVGHTGFGMGMAVGDIDGDGDPDLLVTNYGPDVLYRNEGDGTFTDVTAQSGVADERWTTSATFLDYDADGDLDLYVAAYVDFDPRTARPCKVRGVVTNCGPDEYEGLPDRLYRNDGTGRFTDVSAETGIAGHRGKGLGVVAGDYDGDGDQDLYVANDGTANLLFINHLDEGRAVFTEEGLFYGVAYGEGAKAEAGMGTDFGDYDGDGDTDIVCTNLEAQTNSLYRNDGGLGATESSYVSGLGRHSLPWVGFGIRFLDHDADGDLDLLVTNGHVLENAEELRTGSRFRQPDQLFDNVRGKFELLPLAAVPERSGRGLATGDYDEDGDADVLITNVGEPPFLLRNDTPRRGSVIGLSLEGAGGVNRDGYGTHVSWQAFGRRQVREARAGGSYCSSSDPRLLLATDAEETAVELRWPGGATETLVLAAGAYHQVVHGRGVVRSTPFRVPPADPE